MARKDVSALRDEAAQAVERGKLKQALALYEELEERQPAEASWPKRLGEVHRRAGDAAAAVAAFERAVDKYVGAGFLVQAVAVAKLILQLDAGHAIGARIAELTAQQRQASKAGATVDAPRRGRAAQTPSPAPSPSPSPSPSPPPTPSPAPAPSPAPPPAPSPSRTASRPPPSPARARPPAAPAAADEPAAQIHDRPPRRSRPITLQAGAAIDSMALSTVMPGTQHLVDADGRPSGIHVIPLPEDDELELSLDDAEVEVDVDLAGDPAGAHAHDAIDAAIASADLELELPPPPPRAAATDREARMALLQTPLLAGLPPRVLEALIHKITLLDLAPGAVLFAEGDRSTSLYIVSEGEVVVEARASGELARLGPGAFFGEVSLITDLPRSATIRAAGPVELLVIDREVIRGLVADHPAVLGVLLRFIRDRLVAQVTRTSALFQPFADPERAELSSQFELVEVDAGAPLIVQGQRADGLYVMLAGRVEVWRDGEAAPVATLGPGEVFGEMSLLGGGGSTAHVRAATRVLALRMPARTFHAVIMTHPPVLEYVGTLAEQRAPAAAGGDDLVDLRLELL
jgi:cAMP-dependent protein kinase regulator